MALDKTGVPLQQNDSVTFKGTVTAISGDTVMVQADTGDTIAVPSKSLNFVTRPIVVAQITGLTDAQKQKLADLKTAQGPFVVFCHSVELQPIARFPNLLSTQLAGQESIYQTYDDMLQFINNVVTSGGGQYKWYVSNFGPTSDFHSEADVSGYQGSVPNGYHAVPPSTQHPGDGSRDWIETDFWNFVQDKP